MWPTFKAYIVFVVALASVADNALAVGTAFGLATGTTGGGTAAAATPTSLAQLTTWLSDSAARVIVLDRIFDYTAAEGTVTGAGCAPWTCTPNPQVSGFTVLLGNKFAELLLLFSLL